MKKEKVQFISNFHTRWTETLILEDGKRLSDAQARKLRCSNDCCCGGLKADSEDWEIETRMDRDCDIYMVSNYVGKG